MKALTILPTAKFLVVLNKKFDLFPAEVPETEKELMLRMRSLEAEGYTIIRRGNDLYGDIIATPKREIPEYTPTKVKVLNFELSGDIF